MKELTVWSIICPGSAFILFCFGFFFQSNLLMKSRLRLMAGVIKWKIRITALSYAVVSFAEILSLFCCWQISNILQNNK